MSEKTDGRLGFVEILMAGFTILFVGLKLGDVIDWSWWWVLSPLWLPVALGIFVILTALAVAALIALIKGEK